MRIGREGWRRAPHWLLAAAIPIMVPASGQDAPRAHASATPAHTTVRITSPLGRTGLGGRLRIVARVQAPPDSGGEESRPVRVRFFVDGMPVGIADAGPPYSVEWTDENPFEAREIVAEAEAADDAVVRDTVMLPPFEVADVTEVRRILLEAGVYDRADRPVSNLQASAFEVRENGVVQPIDIASRETLPTTVVLLVDNSQSMSRRITEVRRAAERFAHTLRPGDRVVIAPFNKQIGAITGPTDDASTIADAISAMRAGGGTSILDSLAQGIRLFDGVEGRRTIILITDGFDENSITDLKTVLDRAGAAGVTIYPVGIGGVSGVSLPGEKLLRDLAGATGGRVSFPWRDSELVAVANGVAADADSRYLITYTPIDQKRDGTWRAITVNAGDGVRVRTRTGYRAPAPPPIRPALEFSLVNAARESVDVSVDDFDVVEDGAPQAIETFQEAVDPVSIVLALDASGSMKRAADAVRQTAAEFVAATRPEDSLALVTFADRPVLAHTVTTNRQSSLDAIAQYEALGGTALYDAVWTSLDHLASVPGRRAVVLLSDGRDENNPGTAPGSTHTLEDVLDLTRQVGAAIFTIGLGDRVARDVLARLARESGGESYSLLDASGLGAQFHLVIDNLRRRYIVSYTSTNPENNGKWRNVQIRPRRHDLIVSAKSGYFAPQP